MTDTLYSTSNVTEVSDLASMSYASDSETLVASAPFISRIRSPTFSLPSLHTYHNAHVKSSLSPIHVWSFTSKFIPTLRLTIILLAESFNQSSYDNMCIPLCRQRQHTQNSVKKWEDEWRMHRQKYMQSIRIQEPRYISLFNVINFVEFKQCL